MDTLEHHLEFEELKIPVCGKNSSGLMLYGTATLSGDEDGFSVVFIELGNGTYLRPRGNGALGFPAAFEDELFKRIAAVIENPKTDIGNYAAGEWADVVEDAKAGDPDRAYDERRDREATESADREREAEHA
jgi:hypothetical protein